MESRPCRTMSWEAPPRGRPGLRRGSSLSLQGKNLTEFAHQDAGIVWPGSCCVTLLFSSFEGTVYDSFPVRVLQF